MNRIVMWGLMLLATACGGYAEDGADEELADVEQAATSYGSDYGFRVDLSGSNARCVTGVQSQVCVVPPNKAVTVKVTGTGMSASQKTEVESLVDGWITRFAAEFTPTGWSITRTTAAGSADVNISYGSNPGTLTTSIHSYAHAVQSNGTTLEDFGASGTWMKYGTIGCTIDNTSIVNDFLPSQEPKVRSHAVDFCVFKGLGIGSGGHPTRGYSIPTTPDASKNGDVAQRITCLAGNYDPAGAEWVFGQPAICANSTDN